MGRKVSYFCFLSQGVKLMETTGQVSAQVETWTES